MFVSPPTTDPKKSARPKIFYCKTWNNIFFLFNNKRDENTLIVFRFEYEYNWLISPRRLFLIYLCFYCCIFIRLRSRRRWFRNSFVLIVALPKQKGAHFVCFCINAKSNTSQKENFHEIDHRLSRHLTRRVTKIPEWQTVSHGR